MGFSGCELGNRLMGAGGGLRFGSTVRRCPKLIGGFFDGCRSIVLGLSAKLAGLVGKSADGSLGTFLFSKNSRWSVIFGKVFLLRTFRFCGFHVIYNYSTNAKKWVSFSIQSRGGVIKWGNE